MSYDKIAERALQLENSMPHSAAVNIACTEADVEFSEFGEIISTLANNLHNNQFHEHCAEAVKSPLIAKNDAEIRKRLGGKIAKKVRSRLARGSLSPNAVFHVLANRAGQRWY